MSNPVKNNQTPPPATDPYAKNYGTGGTQTDPYGEDGYDPGMGGDEYGMDEGYADEFIGDDLEGGGEAGGAQQSTYSASELRDMIKAVKDQLSPSQYASFWGRVNLAAAMSPEKQQAEMTKIAGELNTVVNPPDIGGVEGTDGEAEPDKEAVITQLKDYKKTLDSITNLTESKRKEYTAKVEQWIESINLGTATPEAVLEQFEGLKEEVQAASLYSTGAQTLAELCQKDPEEIDKAAKAKGLDLNNLPSPPTKEVIEFLKDISPDLGEKLKKVEDAVKARNDSIEETKAACNAQNSANTRCTSDGDDTSMTNFQKQYDLKYHQDQKSQDVMNAMKEANSEIVNLLGKLYPDATVSLPAQDSGTGWQAMDSNYKSADKISFGGADIDIFNSTNGALNVGAADAETAVSIVTIQYDWEGSGDWEDGAGRPSVTTYGDDISRNIYD